MKRSRRGGASQNDQLSDQEDAMGVCAAPTQQGPLFYAIMTLQQPSEVEQADTTGLPNELILYASSHAIGRNSSTDKEHLQLNKPFISASHARVEVKEGEEVEELVVSLQDLSSNGTHVNGNLIGKNKSVILADGDLVMFFKPRDPSKAPVVYLYKEMPQGRSRAGYEYRCSQKKASVPLAASTTKSVQPSKKPAASSGGPLTAQQQPQQRAGSGYDEELMRNNKQLREKNVYLSGQVEAQAKRCKSLEEDLVRVKAEGEKALQRAREEWEADLAEQRKQWEESNATKAEEIRKSQEKVTALQQEVAGLKQEATHREALNGALQEDKQELEGRNKEIAERLAQLRSECNKTKTLLDKETAKVKHLTTQVEDLKAKNSDLEKQVYTAQSEARALTEAKGEMEALLKQKEEEVVGLEERIKSLEDVGQKSEVLHEEIEAKKNEIARLKKLADDHHTTSSKLMKEQMEAEERVKALEMEVEEKKKEVEAGKQGMDGLKEKVSELEALVKEAEGRMQALELAEKEAKAESEDKSRKLITLEGEISSLIDRCTVMKSKVAGGRSRGRLMQKILAEQVELLLIDLKSGEGEAQDGDEEEVDDDEDGMQGSLRYHHHHGRRLLGEGEEDHLDGAGTPTSCGGHTHASASSSQQNHLRGSTTLGTTQGDDRPGSQGPRTGCSGGSQSERKRKRVGGSTLEAEVGHLGAIDELGEGSNNDDERAEEGQQQRMDEEEEEEEEQDEEETAAPMEERKGPKKMRSLMSDDDDDDSLT